MFFLSMHWNDGLGGMGYGIDELMNWRFVVVEWFFAGAFPHFGFLMFAYA
jgi:hypothetical protein